MGQIIIVEGKSDTRRLKEVLGNINTFETSGLGLDNKKINQLKELAKHHELIVFTDPDGPGEIIRELLIANVKDLKHAYLPNEKALSKNLDKVGIEYATKKDIINALNHLYEITASEYHYEIQDLIDFGIYNNKTKRLLFCNELKIAYGNNKKVVKQLNNFNIKPEKIRDAIIKISEESNGTSKH